VIEGTTAIIVTPTIAAVTIIAKAVFIVPFK
jgi:hypothetical protein